MKKLILIGMTIFTLFVITGCQKVTETDLNKDDNNNSGPTKSEVIDWNLSENGDFIIAESEVKDEITFYNVDVNGINVQLIIVRASDGTIRTVFNTCQVCNPSPMAYFVREGDYLVCQNCGNRYHIDKLGLEKGGCNPIPIGTEERADKDGNIVVPSELLELIAPRFENLAIEK